MQIHTTKAARDETFLQCANFVLNKMKKCDHFTSLNSEFFYQKLAFVNRYLNRKKLLTTNLVQIKVPQINYPPICYDIVFLITKYAFMPINILDLRDRLIADYEALNLIAGLEFAVKTPGLVYFLDKRTIPLGIPDNNYREAQTCVNRYKIPGIHGYYYSSLVIGRDGYYAYNCHYVIENSWGEFGNGTICSIEIDISLYEKLNKYKNIIAAISFSYYYAYPPKGKESHDIGLKVGSLKISPSLVHHANEHFTWYMSLGENGKRTFIQ